MIPTAKLAAVREQFPVTTRQLYLDSAHQTPLALSVREALEAFLSEGFEMAGPKPVWLRRVEETRESVATFFNAAPTEIAFTKNTSEGLNIAANAVPLRAGDNVVLIEGDHPNNAYAWLNLKRNGIEVRFAPLPDDEIATAKTFEPYIDARTKVVSLSHVTFHAGQVHDLMSIGRLCKARGIYLIVDAMQSVGVIPLDVKALNISVLAAGTHKGLLVPQGLGVLYIADGLDELQPAYLAMSSMANPPADYVARPDDMALRKDARRFEFGNVNLPDLHALSAAICLIQSVGVAAIQKHVLALGDLLLERLDALGVSVVGPRARGKRNHIYVLKLPVDKWTDYFARNNVRVSPERGGIRVSLAMFNTVGDIERLIEMLRIGLTRGTLAATEQIE
ncbi:MULTISPECIES: aminotransferase class V-fold PLP-dependent enzyme [unclassified Caballeronia]|uniref:aminotransferase class V-fold PLP-dependent enzyme n=1 Tax=unclassified Caballeronia TaxID=2646786 RepID=UPI0020281592|nr:MULTISPECIES: aminotransferase class V-fold PLP-dependent enzyme [unclassified Caballeronia]MDR5766792.1 aminotransferase class V-fold PLP-dependent enzyme [Caballeronia sp. LZ028]